MKSNAIVLTGGYLDTNSAKTAHGLIRGSDRFTILAIIDAKCASRDAGEVLDGKPRNIPVWGSLKEYFLSGNADAQYCIIGVATKGGIIPESLKAQLREALSHGLGLVNGLHEYVSDIPELAELAKDRGLEIIDVRKPKKAIDLHFWSGKIKEVLCPKVAVLGTDCALGKRTTTRILTESMKANGYSAEMIYTGQTGWMQGAAYGFIFDSTLNDFVSGELENAVVSCYRERKPDIIFVEGQSSLSNPSGPAGAEWIVSADATGIILQHDPVRKQYKDLEYYPAFIPSLEDTIAMIKMYGAPTLGIAVNSARMNESDVRKWCMATEQRLGIPVVLPFEEEDITRLVPMFEKLIAQTRLNL
jgi:uncharacterized NAD-dependent epimerase/dehydratase family protein